MRSLISLTSMSFMKAILQYIIIILYFPDKTKFNKKYLPDHEGTVNCLTIYWLSKATSDTGVMSKICLPKLKLCFKHWGIQILNVWQFKYCPALMDLRCSLIILPRGFMPSRQTVWTIICLSVLPLNHTCNIHIQILYSHVCQR